MRPIVIVAALAAVAHAQPNADPTTRAKTLYVSGKAHFDLAEYPAAIADWKDAYKLSKAPMLLFNIGQAYRLSGDCAAALRTYATYEREAAKPPPNADELELAKGRCNPAPTNANPPDQPPRPPEPIAAPTPTGVDAINEPPAPRHDDRDDRAGTTTEWIGLGTATAGALLLGTTYYFAHQASSNATTVSSYVGEWTATQADLASTGRRDATIAKLTGVAGGLAVLGGATLFVLGYRTHAAAQVTVGITPTGSEVTWRVAF